MDAFLDCIKFFIIGFAIGWLWDPVLDFAKMLWHGVNEMRHEWKNPKEK